MDNKKFVGEKTLAFSRNLGLAISFVIHVFLGSGFVALNAVTIEQEEFELLESQSIELNSPKIMGWCDMIRLHFLLTASSITFSVQSRQIRHPFI